jgi:HSP20 family protein
MEELVSEENEKSILTQLKAMKQRMDALFTNNFERNESGNPAKDEAPGWRPFVDMYEDEGYWLIIADLPGVPDAELQVEVLNDQLIIAGKRAAITPSPKVRTIQAERPSGSFSRSFVLPQRTRSEAIEAEFKRGVLTVKIPKDENTPQPLHKIEVQSE